MNNDNQQQENHFINTWKSNFAIQVKSIRMEYDAFFMNREIEDYYFFESNENVLSLHFHNTYSLPHDILKALELAFIKSKPAIKTLS